MTLKKIAALLSIAGIVTPAFATNGMNMEGYGPVASGMGGASFAYDNGTAGLINNPATLGLMPSGTSRFDIAVGGLHPDVTSKMSPMPNADSDGTAYYMPAMGYVRKDGKLTYGAGLMAQGGMGTEYGSSSFLSGYRSAMTLFGGGTNGASGAANRSELGLGRVMFPLTYDVTDSFQVGGTVDYLWGGLDIQMVMDGAMFTQFAGLMGQSSPLGTATGSMVTTLGGMLGGAVSDVNWAQFDFSKGKNGMTQQLTTTGFAANLGFVWKAAPGLAIGGVYHAKTKLDDMEGNGTLRMQAIMGGNTTNIPIAGKLKVVDFQWPETYGVGMAYQVSDRFMLAADYKRIAWSKVMKNFRMSFTANAVQSDPTAQMMVSAGATNMDATLVQNWEDQDVFMFGGSFKAADAVTVRAGVNIANNPIPDAYMNPLFPAIVKNHYMGGVGYAISKASSVDFSFTYAPEVSATNSTTTVTTTHSQTNWQLMYSQRF